MRLADTIYLPGTVSPTRKPYTATVETLIGENLDRWESVALTMINDGRLTTNEWDTEDFDLADVVDRLSLSDVSNLTDDPNVKLVPIPITHTVEMLAQVEVEAARLRDTRDQQIRFLASQGWSTRDISGVAGVNHAMVARILKAL